MGMLIDGQWRDVDRATREGAFVRRDSAFRNRVTADGSSGFKAEPGRYHLYVSLACPWASRTIVVRKLKKLEGVVGMTVVSPDMLENGWTFGGDEDALTGARFLYEVYARADPAYSGPVTVPVLWDRERATIVNNESSEIIRMLGREFDAWGDRSVDLVPADLADDIDAVNARIYDAVNNGVYKAGFATAQEPYDVAVTRLFAMLDELEERLSRQRYLFGRRLTEADIRLFPTLVRFDLVYYGHFKCNRQHLWDYPSLHGWLRDLYQRPGMAETVSFAHIKRHYYGSQRWVNPSGVVPIGPTVDLIAPHGREALG